MEPRANENVLRSSTERRRIKDIRLGPLGSCGESDDWPRSQHSEKLDLEDGDKVTISVTADAPVKVTIFATADKPEPVVIALYFPNIGWQAPLDTRITALHHAGEVGILIYEAESSDVYEILINSTWPENQSSSCAGQDAGVQYEYIVVGSP